MIPRYALTLLAPAALLAVAHADEAASAGTGALSEVVVTATRIGMPAFEIPAAISSVPGEQLRVDALDVNLSDDIMTVPGLLARNRYNYAQDQQLSIRGIGANSTIGIRGVRVYQDGMPASSPDGQGQVSQFNIDSADRVEVLRGPFSALYGNSAGGVIQIFTADGKPPDQVRAALAYGSFDNLRAALDASGALGALGYNADLVHFSVDGYRPHSSAQSDWLNTKLNYSFSDSSRLSLVGNLIARPDAQDPLGLTVKEYEANPTGTDPAAAQFNTRKSLQQQQGGLIYDWDFTSEQSMQAMAYYGHRIIQQYLAIPVSAQVSPTSAGGVVDLNRQYGGTDVRWSWRGSLADRPMTWVAGLAFDRQDELRRGFNDYIGPQLGVQGALRRDENDIENDLDEYLQGSWDFASQWSLMLGARHSDVNFDTVDHYITATNGNASGEKSYVATSPVAALNFKPLQWLHVYADYGRGFQTPVSTELAYRPDEAPGPNLALQPARSDNGELGVKLQLGSDLQAEAALFQTLTRDEIVVATNIGGRATYQNAGRTRREGAELSVDYRMTRLLRGQLAYTYLDATYSDAYLTCVTSPCPRPTALVAAGNRLPGVPHNDAYAVLRWGADSGWRASANIQSVSGVAANDSNTVSTPNYTIVGVDAGYGADLRRCRWSAFVRINNLFDRHYVGSVIVDDGNGRYFEPGAPLMVLGGASVTFW